jgi:hypothetical protein
METLSSKSSNIAETVESMRFYIYTAMKNGIVSLCDTVQSWSEY